MSVPTAVPSSSASSLPAGADSSARRRQLVLLALLLAVLAALVVFVLMPALFGSGGGSGPAPVAQRPGTAPGAAAATPEVVTVHLDRLDVPPVDPEDSGRNPFRMGAASRPAESVPVTRPQVPAGPGQQAPLGPPGPPPVPPIPFRFIGIVTPGASGEKIAVLSDGKNVVHGREGGIVDGRYRIVKIGEESLQIEHVDGRGRQTLRLSGQ